MEWEGREQSGNVEDRRGGGGVGKRGLAVGGGASILALLVAFLLGGPQAALDALLQQQKGQPGAPQKGDPKGGGAGLNDKAKEFAAVVLKDTEDVWDVQFRQMGKTYKKPKMVLFSEQVQSGCGLADSGIGPFYCPADQTVYLDPTFFNELATKFGAPGDFANAYVIAHEVGHHVSHLLGYTERVHGEQGRVNKTEYNRLSVRLELQADCLAGVWAHHAQKMKHILHRDDIDEALNAANAIGDDRLQKAARGTVRPDTFTHGTSKQRIKWFKRGFDTGNIDVAKSTFDLAYDEL